MIRWKLIVGLCVAVAVPTAAENGVVVNHPPDQIGSWPSDTDYPASGGSHSQRLADDFVLETPAEIRRITWWGSYYQPSPPATETMQLRIHQTDTNTGLPGGVLFESNVTNPMRAQTGLVVSGAPWTLNSFPEYIFQFELSAPVVLNANTLYWLEIVQLGNGGSSFIWELSSTSESGFASANPSNAPWVHASSLRDLAFQLSTIPEPVSLMCLTCSFLVIQRHPRRRCV